MSTEYDLAAILKLINAAFDLEGLNDFCFIYFQPVYDLFTEADRKSVRVWRLVEHAERKGQLADLLALIQEENPGRYAQFASQLFSSRNTAPEQTSRLVGPSAPAGNTVFNQAGQRVITQYNVVGDLNISSKSPASPLDSEEQHEILRVIYLSQKETPNQFVDDSYIAEELSFDIEDVRMHLDLLEAKALVKQAKTFGGTSATVTSQGRLIVRG